MALVLIDGSTASARAIDVAIQPKLFVSKFESEQVVLVHGWRPDAANLNSKETVANLQPIIRAATEQLEKSKFHQGQINYKLELYKAPSGSGGGTSTWTVAGYASERADHYKAEALVLGVGNVLNGKNLVVGSVANEVLSKHSGIRDLWFVKASGSTIRPTAPVRLLVIVDAVFAAAKGTHRSLEHVTRLVQPEKRGKVSIIILANQGGISAPPQVLAALTKEATQMITDEHAGDDVVAPAAESSEQPGVSILTLEPIPQAPQPTVNDVMPQFTKFLGHFKTDFLVLTPPCHGTFSEPTIMTLLSNPKYHIVVPRGAQVQR
jgi:hypothetical protein